MDYSESKQIVFLLKNGDWAFPVKVDSNKTGNTSFRSAPQSINVLGTNWDENEVETSETDMVNDVVSKGRRTRSISESQRIFATSFRIFRDEKCSRGRDGDEGRPAQEM